MWKAYVPLPSLCLAPALLLHIRNRRRPFLGLTSHQQRVCRPTPTPLACSLLRLSFLPTRVLGHHGDGCPVTEVGPPYRLASADITTTAAPLLGLSFPTDPRPLWTYRRRSSSRPASSLDVPATVAPFFRLSFLSAPRPPWTYR